MEPSQEQIEKWHNDSKNWKAYFFYFNKEDNRLFVDKRNRWAGINFNFANPKSYWFLFGMVCFFGFILYKIDKNGN